MRNNTEKINYVIEDCDLSSSWWLFLEALTRISDQNLFLGFEFRENAISAPNCKLLD